MSLIRSGTRNMFSPINPFSKGRFSLLILLTFIYSITLSKSIKADDFLDPLVVNASRFEQPLSEVLSSVTVITKEEIQRSQARSVSELLQGEPGVEVSTNGGLGAQSSFFLRGESSSSVAIFVDGIRIQPDGFGSLNNTSLPPPQAIERIEILRGNSGALYGEAAIGGVINIYTSAGSSGSPKSFVTLTYGTNKTIDTTAGVSGRVGDTKFNVTANGTNSAGFTPIDHNVFPTSLTNTGDFKSDGIGFGVSQLINKDWEIGLKERYQDKTLDYNANIPIYDLGAHSRTISSDTTLFAKASLLDAWFSQLDITHSKLDYQFTPTSAATNSASDTDSLNWSNTYEINRSQKVTFGISYSDQHFNDGYGDLMYRKSYGVFAGDTLRWNKFDFQINARRDGLQVSQPDAVVAQWNTVNNTTSTKFGATTGLAGIGYHLSDELRVSATSSMGFRAPSVGEYFQGTVFNPNLVPELHHTLESAIEYKNTITNTRLVYFNSSTENAITYNDQFNYTNIPIMVNHGWEFSERANWKGYRLVGAFTSQNPTDESPNPSPILRRAKQFGSLDLGKSVDAYDFGAKYVASSSRTDGISFYPTVPTTLAPYKILSLYAGYKYSEEFTYRLRLDNARDEKYQLAYGYNTAGRTAWLTMIYQQK